MPQTLLQVRREGGTTTKTESNPKGDVKDEDFKVEMLCLKAWCDVWKWRRKYEPETNFNKANEFKEQRAKSKAEKKSRTKKIGRKA